MIEVTVPSYQLVYNKKAVTKALRQAANEIARTARKLIRSSSGGGEKRGSHTASRPGSPPAKLSGLLASSIRTRVRVRGTAIVARISDNANSPTGAPYSKFLETGAYGGGGRPGSSTTKRTHKRKTAAERKASASTKRVMEPRPYLSLAMEQSAAAIKPRLEASILSGVEFAPKKAGKK